MQSFAIEHMCEMWESSEQLWWGLVNLITRKSDSDAKKAIPDWLMQLEEAQYDIRAIC